MFQLFFDFHLYLGKISNLTCAYFSDGWFNHQLVNHFQGMESFLVRLICSLLELRGDPILVDLIVSSDFLIS